MNVIYLNFEQCLKQMIFIVVSPFVKDIKSAKSQVCVAEKC